MNIFSISIRGVLWKIHCHWNNPCLVLEERNVESKQLSFRGIDVATGVVQFDIKAMSWWENYIAAYNFTLLTTGYPALHLPKTQGIYAYDTRTGNVAWQNPNLDFMGINSAGYIIAEPAENAHQAKVITDLSQFAQFKAEMQDNISSEEATHSIAPYRLDIETGAILDSESADLHKDPPNGLLTSFPYPIAMPQLVPQDHQLSQLARQQIPDGFQLVEMATLQIEHHQLAILTVTNLFPMLPDQPSSYLHQLLLLENNQMRVIADLGEWREQATGHIGISFGQFGCVRTTTNQIHILSGLNSMPE
jgi:hypothetical protein